MRVDCASRTVITSLLVPASSFGGCLADFEVAGDEVREDDRWLMLSCENASKG